MILTLHRRQTPGVATVRAAAPAQVIDFARRAGRRGRPPVDPDALVVGFANDNGVAVEAGRPALRLVVDGEAE